MTGQYLIIARDIDSREIIAGVKAELKYFL
jgi:hypothetical protein